MSKKATATFPLVKKIFVKILLEQYACSVRPLQGTYYEPSRLNCISLPPFTTFKNQSSCRKIEGEMLVLKKTVDSFLKDALNPPPPPPQKKKNRRPCK